MNGHGECARARLELGVYLLGAIEPARRAFVEGHLAACPACRAELALLAGLPALLRRVPVGVAMHLGPDDAVAGVAPIAVISVIAMVRVSNRR